VAHVPTDPASVLILQKLQDYDSVYLASYVDDLDNYLQGVLNEVNGVDIPTLLLEWQMTRTL
jgi:hypothetical protein